MEHHLLLPLTREKAAALSSGDQVYISGVIYTVRNAAHKRLLEFLVPMKNPGASSKQAC
jgi:fumarate hydratase subunit beta